MSPAPALALALALALSFAAPASAIVIPSPPVLLRASPPPGILRASPPPLVMPSPPVILRASPPPPAPVSSRVAAPAALVGTWVGDFSTAFALADAANPWSWSCIVGSAVVTTPHSIAISADGTVLHAPYPSSSVADFPRGAALPGRNLTFPGSQAVAQYDVLGVNAAILTLGLPMSSVATSTCHYASVAAGFDGVAVLTFVSVGGALFSRDAQCSASTYTLNVSTTPFCTSSSPGGAALGTNVVGLYRLALAPAPMSSSSPSASAPASASAPTPASSAPPTPIPGRPIDASLLPSPPAGALEARSAASSASAVATAPLAATVLTLLAGVALGGFIERARA